MLERWGVDWGVGVFQCWGVGGVNSGVGVLQCWRVGVLIGVLE